VETAQAFASTDDASAALQERLRALAQTDNGWLGFDTFMREALYAPGLGYYSSGRTVLGQTAADGSDFVTAPELSPAFGQSIARQIAQWWGLGIAPKVLELGAGSGALMLQIIEHAIERGYRQSAKKPSNLAHYSVLDVSGSLRARQERAWQTSPHRADWTAQWLEALPQRIDGVVLANEVLDAMPVQVLVRRAGQWLERGVVWANGAWAWQERPTALRPPVEPAGEGDYETEIHPQAEAFVATLAHAMHAGSGAVALFIDYGFSEAEYYHPQRHMGTLVAHRAHRVGADVLADVGQQDLTAHVNFTGIAVAAQNAGLDVLGYTTQARFLMNCGILQDLEHASLAERSRAQKLLTEHEMGALFKVMALCTPAHTQTLLASMGFAQGDLTHKL
jgi:SAM-dependent MidA family methyltransferase